MAIQNVGYVGINSPASSLLAVTPSDTIALPAGVRQLIIGAGGTITVRAIGDAAPVTITVFAGQALSILASYVYATNTTATGIVALL